VLPLRRQAKCAMRLFLTGAPGIGKTTLIRAVVEQLDEVTSAGFYTQEKRRRGQRTGFTIVTLNGEAGSLASIGRKEPTVGRYSIDVEGFEALVLPSIDPGTSPADLYVIDEIGRMELLSRKFRNKIIDLLAQPTNLLATIAKKGKGFVEQIKGRNDIELIEVTRENRGPLREEIRQRIKTELGKV
jgi:nucleoside-triphosphatase